MQDLGMADFLKEYEDWNNPPIPGYGVDVKMTMMMVKWQVIMLLIC